MTNEHKVLKRKLQKFAKLLGVSDYLFEIAIAKDRKSRDKYDLYGSVLIDEETRKAIISLNEYYLKKEPEEIDNTLVHELLHVRFSELLSLVTLIIAGHVKDKKAQKTYIDQIERLEHKIIVTLTNAIRKK